MYASLPSVDFTVDRKGFVLVDGKRAFNQPGEPLRYQSMTLLTCQHCGRRAVAHSLRVVSESDERVSGGVRYFHALENGQTQSLCTDCQERESK